VTRAVTALVITVSIGSSAALAREASEPSRSHHAKVDDRGDHVMGFDHTKTSHHFLLTPSGGSIEVSVTDPDDAASRDAIRGHLAHIARMFSEGDFEAPMLIHDRVPSGVPMMKRKKAVIDWKYEETATGGRVRITTKDPGALAAIHQFLKFQIEDHQTGDSTGISKETKEED
jgi:hypothetical protein